MRELHRLRRRRGGDLGDARPGLLLSRRPRQRLQPDAARDHHPVMGVLLLAIAIAMLARACWCCAGCGGDLADDPHQDARRRPRRRRSFAATPPEPAPHQRHVHRDDQAQRDHADQHQQEATRPTISGGPPTDQQPADTAHGHPRPARVVARPRAPSPSSRRRLNPRPPALGSGKPRITSPSWPAQYVYHMDGVARPTQAARNVRKHPPHLPARRRRSASWRQRLGQVHAPAHHGRPRQGLRGRGLGGEGAERGLPAPGARARRRARRPRQRDGGRRREARSSTSSTSSP